MTNVSVIGLGYMGLPMAAVLAKAGHTVRGVDIDPHVVASVNAGMCPFAEPGMPELVRAAHESGRLIAAETPEAAEVFVLSLPTPVDHETHAPDMRFVEAGAKSIAPVLKDGDLVILESTSPVGATQANVVAVIEKLRPELAGKVDYAFCPERAIPGNTLKEMIGNDRLVGGLSMRAAKRTAELYGTFCTGKLLQCSAAEAEMVKLVENASRDAQIAFANELSLVCDRLGLDAGKVIELANHHPRVNILSPGTGVGGHCIAVDPWFIINAAPEVTPLMRAARHVNDGKPKWVVQQVEKALATLGKPNATVACLGLAYKPDVDDLRESPSIAVVEDLEKLTSIRLAIVEPHLTKWDRTLWSLEDALREADIVVVLTGHSLFKQMPEGVLRDKIVVDPVGILRGRDDVVSFFPRHHL